MWSVINIYAQISVFKMAALMARTLYLETLETLLAQQLPTRLQVKEPAAAPPTSNSHFGVCGNFDPFVSFVWWSDEGRGACVLRSKHRGRSGRGRCLPASSKMCLWSNASASTPRVSCAWWHQLMFCWGMSIILARVPSKWNFGPREAVTLRSINVGPCQILSRPQARQCYISVWPTCHTNYNA